MNDILTRIKLVISNTKLSDTAFAKSIGVPQGTFSNMFRRNSIPGADIVATIAKKYKINASWLLTGEGEMFHSASKSEPEKPDMKKTIDRLIKEIEVLKKENSELADTARKIEEERKRLDDKNRAISDELLERMRQLVAVQSRQLEPT
jgi:transcriptional regulator with XRE-family HTH domain